MTTRVCSALALSVAMAFGLSSGVLAQAKKKTQAAPAAASPKKVGSHGKWDVYVQAGKTKLCYTTSKPTKRAPANLKDAEAYVFISTRPAQNVRNEIAIKMGFDVKPDGKPTVNIGSTKFTMVANGNDLFVENPADEKSFVAALRKGSELVVHATSKRGNDTTDNYSLSGIGAALDSMQKECK